MGDPFYSINNRGLVDHGYLGRYSDLGGEALELVDALDDKDTEVRRSAISGRGRVGAADERIVPLLVDALDDEDKAVRITARSSLISIIAADQHIVAAVIAAIDDEEPRARLDAAIKLMSTETYNDFAVTTLIEALGDQDVEGTLTVPEEAVRFVAETRVDSLAVAIGTSHGATKFSGEPRLDFDRLERIAGLVDLPLVMHGASAVAEEDVASIDDINKAMRFGFNWPTGPLEMVAGARKGWQ